MKAHLGGEKKILEKEITRLKTEIALLTHGSNKVSGFDWAVEFAEVFADGGFDVVVANPPYVRQELIKHLKPTLQKIYPDVYTGTADLYCYFYARALELLRSSGMLTFISSNKWFRANYGSKLRQHIAENCQVNSITDFGELPVFKSAAVLVMIFIARKGKTSNFSSIFTQVESLKPPYPNVTEIIQNNGHILSSDSLRDSNWILTDVTSASRIQKMELAGIPLGEYINGKIYLGIKTGCNKAFIINKAKRAELIAQDPKSTEIIKPLVTGKNIRKWCIDSQDKWLIVTKIGTDIKNYPAIFNYLKQWQSELERRSDKGEYWWELRACAYYNEFDKPKIIYPGIAKEPCFVLDTEKVYTNNTTYMIPVDDFYLLGVLNSSSTKAFFLNISPQILGENLRFFRQYVEKIPIPNSSVTEREAISKLVQKCLDAKGNGCEKWEKEIDDRVAVLYGL